MISLSRQVCRRVHVAFGRFELRVAQIAPENRSHSNLVRVGERAADLYDLPRRFFRAEIDCCADGYSTKIARLINSAEENLIELVRIGQKLVVIYFDDERNLVCVTAGNHA